MCALSLDDYCIIFIVVLSTPFPLHNGVKQGGVLSPILFSMCIDSLLEKLKDSGLGCHVCRTFAGTFAYADDIALVSPSLSGPRQMIPICEQYAMEYSILIFGRFYYDKSTKTLYNIHTIEIKDIKCIHKGRENGMTAILLRLMF